MLLPEILEEIKAVCPPEWAVDLVVMDLHSDGWDYSIKVQPPGRRMIMNHATLGNGKDPSQTLVRLKNSLVSKIIKIVEKENA